MSTTPISTTDYSQFVSEIKQEIKREQYLAYRVSNSQLIQLYWFIGKSIVERQQQLGWGKAVVESLSHDLQAEFDGANGFSADNLQRMRQLYIEYSGESISEQLVPKLKSSKNSISGQLVPKLRSLQNAILGQLVPELYHTDSKVDNDNTTQAENYVYQLITAVSWGHNILIMKKCKSIAERIFYLENTIQLGWSRNVLLNQIKASAFERCANENKTNNFALTLPEYLAEQAIEASKSVYNLEFMNIKKPVLERELEHKLLENLKRFILELGYGFCFIGNQYRLAVHGKEYFIDLLFYHRFLKTLVAIELKTGEFEPEHAGKMDFYLNLLNEYEKAPDDNPSIGIILCAAHEKWEVEFALKSKQNPIGELYNQLPDNYKKQLPSPEQWNQFTQKISNLKP